MQSEWPEYDAENIGEEQVMTLGEELRTKYALTSLKAKGAWLVPLAINEALEVAAEIAEQERSPLAAARIRNLKWTDRVLTPVSVTARSPVARTV